jgi:hypothetical protein
MCMIVYRPVHKGRGSNISGAVIDTALHRHPDGFGVAYRLNGELVSERFGPREAKRFRKALKRVDRDATQEYVAHFRFATHGAKDAAHAHPYEYVHPVDGRVLVFHNGVIDIATKGDESDTEVFVKLVLARLPSRWWEDPALMFLVTETVGYSKLVVMTRDGTYNLHEKRGNWDGGIWYSSQHKPTPTTYKAPTGAWTPGTSYGYWDEVHKRWVSTWSAQQAVKAGSTDVALRVLPPTASPDRAVIATSAVTHSIRGADGRRTFRHGGHTVSALVEFGLGSDADYTDGVMCDECDALGDMFVIDGSVYIDMAHVHEPSARDEEDADAAE